MDENTYISIRCSNGCIRVFKKAIRLLGKPSYIRFFLSNKGKLLAVEPYDKKTFTSFRVPKNLYSDNGAMVVYSKMLCTALYSEMGWDEYELYRIPGKVLYKERIAIFDLNRAVPYEEDDN